MMKEFEMCGEHFQYEKLMAEKFEKGTCAFKVVDADGDTSYWVVVPATLQKQVDGEVIDTPNDGHLAAVCMSEQDALMVASSICIAAGVVAKDKAGKKALADIAIAQKVADDIAQKVAKDIGFDLDALEAEVKRLKSEGKSDKEVSEILKPRMEEFRTKKPQSDTKGGEW